MDDKEYLDSNYSEYSGKIRIKSTKKNRNNPYKNPKKNINKQNENADQGILGKVSTYIMPTWLTGWWSQPNNTKDEEKEYSSEEEEDTSDATPVVPKIYPSIRKEINHNAVPDLIASSSTSSINYGLKPDLFKNVFEKDNVSFKVNAYENISTVKSKTLSNTFATKPFDAQSTVEHNIDNQSSVSFKYLKTDSSVSEIEKIDSDLAAVPNETIIHKNPHSILNISRNTRPSPSKLARPSFKVSAFIPPSNTSLQSNLNMSLNSTSFDFSSSANKSLFYSGQTVYGGSSSIREKSSKRQKLSPVSNQVLTTRTQIKAKPLKVSKRKAVTSDTAKKILSTLDKMSSPLKDAKRMPALKTYKPSLSQQLRKSNLVFNQRKPALKTAPPIKAIKKDVSFVNDKSFFKKSETIQEISPDSNTFSNIPKFSKIAVPASSTVLEDGGKISMKMKRDRTTSHYSGSQSSDTEIVNTMPDVSKVSAPLVMNSLPTFNFMSKPTSSIISSMPAFTPIPKAAKTESKICSSSVENKETFSFAKPGIKSECKLMSTPSIKSFSFSNPLAVQKQSKENENVVPTEKKLSFAAKFQNPKGSWDCATCMVTNSEDANTCVACSTCKPIATKIPAPIATFKEIKPFRQFSKPIQVPSNSWACPTCMINNKESDLKCVACSEKKPLANNSSEVQMKPAAQKPFTPLKTLKNLQPTEPGAWDCPTCMIKNKPLDNKCVACSESKPGATKANPQFENKLKLKFATQNADSWECPTCMIKNKNDILKCVACSESKPGSKISDNTSEQTDSKPTMTGFSFGVAGTTGGFSFGKPAESTGGISFGKPSESAGGFSFGKPSTITFGAPKDTSKEDNSTETEKSLTPFGLFGTPQKDKSSFLAFGPPKEITKTTSGFGTLQETSNNSLFGVPQDSKIQGQSSGFGFSKPETTDTKDDSSKSKNQTDNPFTKEASASSFANNFKFQPRSENIIFGSTTQDANTSAGFSFGKPKTETNTAGFSFGKSDKTETTAGFSFGKDQDSSAGFSFGQSKTETNQKVAAPQVNFANPIINNSSVKIPPFNVKPIASPLKPSTTNDAPFKSIAEAAAAGFLNVPVAGDSMPNTEEKVSENKFSASAVFGSGTGGFSFANTADTQLPSTFGTSTLKTDKPTFNFGNAATVAKTNEKPGFNFGSAASPSFNFGDQPAQAGLFGSSINNNLSNKAPSGFGIESEPVAKKVSFEQPSSAPTFNFGSTQPNPFAANSAANPSPNPFAVSTNLTNGFNFGASSKPSFLSGSTPSFMSESTQPSFMSAGVAKPSFLSNASQPPAAGGFNFTATVPQATMNGQSDNPFSIGAPTHQPSNNDARRKITARRRQQRKK